jgi:dihydrofolate reductase
MYTRLPLGSKSLLSAYPMSRLMTKINRSKQSEATIAIAKKMNVRLAGIISNFMQHGLVDEYRSVVAPLATGKDKPFHKDIKNNELDTKLSKMKTYTHRRNYIYSTTTVLTKRRKIDETS